MASTMAPDPRKALGGLRFNLSTLDTALGSRRLPRTMPVSVVLHVLAAAALFLVPVLSSSDIPEPAAAVHAFFVEPTVTVAPPPPPPPPAARSAAHRPTEPPHPADHAFVAPVDVPTEVPNPGLDLGVDGGMPGGVEGGVEGGVVGGVVGGLPSEPAATPIAPVRVGGGVKPPTRLKYVAPEYPPLAARARVSGVVIIDAVLSPDGHVTGAKVLRSIAMLDDAALEAVRQWVYTPTLLGGVPVPVEMTVTVTFNLTS